MQPSRVSPNGSLTDDTSPKSEDETIQEAVEKQQDAGDDDPVIDETLPATSTDAYAALESFEPTTSHTQQQSPYCVLHEREKVFLLLTASFAGMISPFSSSTYYPAVPALAKSLNTSITLVDLTISTYLIFQGLAPSFTAAFSEKYGRRPAYLFCFTVNLGANIGLALQSNYAALLVLRCVQSAGSSGTIALASGIVSDLSTRAERGKYIVFATMGTMLGPAFGPLVGGLLSQYLGWRAIFWFLVILGGVMGTLVAVAFRETSRSIVGNCSVPPPRWNRSLLQCIRNDDSKGSPEVDLSTLDQRPRRMDLLASIKVFRDKENALIILYTCMLWAGYICITSILSSQIARRYGFDEVQIGLCYLPLGLGSLSSRWTVAYIIDWNFRRVARKSGVSIEKNKQQDIAKIDVEKARLAVAMPLVFGASCCVIAYGWLMEFRSPLAAVLVILFFMGNTNTGSFVCVQALVTDTNRERTASAAAAGNLARCLLGAATVAVANPLINAISIGWTSTMIAFLWIAFAPCMWLVYRNGHRWRVKQLQKERARRESERAANPTSKAS